MSEVYSLYLNSTSGSTNPYMPQASSSLVSRTYQINWDSFFNLANKRFRKCRVRYEFYSDPSTGTQMDPTTYNAVLGLVGVNSMSSTKYGATVLGVLSLDTVSPTSAAPQTCLVGANMTSPGQNLYMPDGVRDLTVSLYQNVTNPLTYLSGTLIQGWAIVLNFELYDPIV